MCWLYVNRSIVSYRIVTLRSVVARYKKVDQFAFELVLTYGIDYARIHANLVEMSDIYFTFISIFTTHKSLKNMI